MLPDLMSLKGILKIDRIKIDNSKQISIAILSRLGTINSVNVPKRYFPSPLQGNCNFLDRFRNVDLFNSVSILSENIADFVKIECSLLSLQRYVGDPIDCFISNNEKSPVTAKVLDTYCWIHSTHTLPNEKTGPIPGLGTPKEGEPIKYHKYYQWVGFFLLFQAICFYLPRMIWKYWEIGRMKSLVEDLKQTVIPSDVERRAKQNMIDYLFINVNQHRTYATAYFVCELLNAINIVGQIFFVDTFLGGEFTEYGGNVLSQTGMDPEDRTDPMSYVNLIQFLNF